MSGDLNPDDVEIVRNALDAYISTTRFYESTPFTSSDADRAADDVVAALAAAGRLRDAATNAVVSTAQEWAAWDERGLCRADSPSGRLESAVESYERSLG